MPSRTSQVRLRILEDLEDAEALCRVMPAASGREVGRERLLPGMPEGRVADVMPESDGFCKSLVERQGGGDATGDLGHLDGVREPGHVMVVVGVHEDLRLVLEATEGLAVHDAVAIALEGGAHGIGSLGTGTPQGGDRGLRCRGQSGGLLGLAGLAIAQDEASAHACHALPPSA